MKKCPYCAEEIQDEAKKCRFCGEWLYATGNIQNYKDNQIIQTPFQPLKKCSRCNLSKKTQMCSFKENVSFFFQRRERDFVGDLCFSCMTKVFGVFTLKTFFGTWWGIIGALLGPAIIGGNIIEYLTNSFKFIKARNNVY